MKHILQAGLIGIVLATSGAAAKPGVLGSASILTSRTEAPPSSMGPLACSFPPNTIL